MDKQPAKVAQARRTAPLKQSQGVQGTVGAKAKVPPNPSAPKSTPAPMSGRRGRGK